MSRNVGSTLMVGDRYLSLNDRCQDPTAVLFAGLLLAYLAVFPAGAEGFSPSAAQQIAARRSPPREEDVGPFLDRTLNAQLALHGIPGAAVAIVQGGKILHLGGYGQADLQQGKPVSAETTLFRTGSVSKLFTWTAVMQLVEQGNLDLHADVNQYLTLHDTRVAAEDEHTGPLKGFPSPLTLSPAGRGGRRAPPARIDRIAAVQIPANYPEPVTLAHLLTHTAGFEDRAFGFYARTAADLQPLGAFLAAHMPARIFPPGEVSAYANYGASLAGHIIERVSGLPFEGYIEQHILDPLGMSSSSFRQPLPPELAARLATGYRVSLEPGDFEWDLAVPAGALSATAADMARFLIAHLQKGRFGTTRILREHTAEAMQRRQFTNHPAVSGLTYGFQELHIAGHRVLAQPGDMLHFTAALFLLPEHDLGLYVAYNRGRAADAPMELLQTFVGRFFASPPWLLSAPVAMSDSDVGRFAGSYRSTRRNETGLKKLQKLFTPVRVRVAGPGVLHISGLAVVPESLWIETERGVFRDRSSPEILAFREDASGRATHLFEGNFPIAGYTRLPWYGAPELHYALLAICTPLFFLTPLGWSVSLLRHPYRGGALLAQRARVAAGSMCVVNLLFLAGIVVVIAKGRELLFGITPLARAVLLLPLLSAVLTGLTLVLAAIAWRRGYWSLWGRLHYSVVALFGLAFIGSLHYWNLLGFRL
ncbi:MAG: serine hydrolase domain-containing protein [Pseudomonadota bacterium]|nr:serine hydrolase domain-containing protein [Pseudomonadota bacterium]